MYLIYCKWILYFAFIRFSVVNSFSIYSNIEPNDSESLEPEAEAEANITDLSDATEVYPPTQLPYITIQQRINRCKELFANYNYEILTDSEQDELSRNAILNPCRVDCVVYQRNPISGDIEKPTYTRYFTDGKTSCYPGKVCTLRGTVGVCALDPNGYQRSIDITIITAMQISTRTSPMPTTTTTTTTTTPMPTTSKLTSSPTTTPFPTTVSTILTFVQPLTTLTTTTTKASTTTWTSTTTKLITTQAKPYAECPYEGFFRDLNDQNCRKFYRCIAMTATTFQRVNYAECQNGLVFAEERGVCVPEYLSAKPCASLHTS